MRFGYSDTVMELFHNPKNAGPMEDATVTAIAGSMACGDMLKIYLKIDPETERIVKASFESYGCVANIATSSMITQMAEGKTVDEAEKIGFREEVDALGGLPKIKYHCASLAVQALRIAISKWKVIRGDKELDVDLSRTILHGILDPVTDKDIVVAGVVRSIEVRDRDVFVGVHIEKKDAGEEIILSIHEAFEKMDVEVSVVEV